MKFPPLKGSAMVKIGIGILAGLVVVVGGFLLVQNVFTKASDSAPRDLIINGITTNSAKLSWTTDQETQGVIEYGSSPTSLNLFAPEPQKEKNHTVEITLLSPATSYYFQIRIGETKYDNGGVPWTFSTKIAGSDVPLATPSAALSVTPVAVPTTAPGQPTSASAFGPLKSSSLRVVPTSAVAPTVTVSSPTTAPYVVPTLPVYVCGETDCQKICQKIGSTCSTQDWMRSGCVGKYTLGSCSIAPTITPSPTVTPTPTVTTTPTPTNTPTPTTGT
jgi:hypothetical protein